MKHTLQFWISIAGWSTCWAYIVQFSSEYQKMISLPLVISIISIHLERNLSQRNFFFLFKKKKSELQQMLYMKLKECPYCIHLLPLLRRMGRADPNPNPTMIFFF